MKPVDGAIAPVVVVGAVAVEVEEEVAVDGEVMEMLFSGTVVCLLMGYRIN